MKRLFFSLIVIGVAFSGSTFTNKELHDYYVQNLDGSYRLITGNLNPDFCTYAGEICAYIQTTNENFGPVLTASEVEALATSIGAPSKLLPIVDLATSQPILGVYYDE